MAIRKQYLILYSVLTTAGILLAVFLPLTVEDLDKVRFVVCGGGLALVGGFILTTRLNRETTSEGTSPLDRLSSSVTNRLRVIAFGLSALAFGYLLGTMVSVWFL